MLEGELIKWQVQENLEKERQKELMKLEAHRQLIQDQKLANEDQMRLNEI